MTPPGPTNGPNPGVAAQLAAQRVALEARLQRVGAVVAVMSGKGGVGKTSVAANLAAALAAGGARVGAVDADLNGQSLALALGVHGQRLALTDQGVRPALGAADVAVMSMDLLMAGDSSPLTWQHVGGLAADTHVWRGLLEANVLREFVADTAWGDLDYLILDLPPGTDRFDVVGRLLPRLDAVVAVTIPTRLSVHVVRKAIAGVQKGGHPVAGIIVNMSAAACPSCGAAALPFGSSQAARDLAAAAGVPVLAEVPFDVNLADAADGGVPLVLSDPASPAAAALIAAARGLQTFLAEHAR